MSNERKMVDSGIDWIGEIPEGWNVAQIKNIASIQVGKTPSTSNSNYFDGGLPWLTIADLVKNGICPENTKKTLSIEGIKSSNLKISKKGSVLISFKLSVGKCVIAKKDIYTNEAIATLNSKSKSCNSFLFWVSPIAFIEEATENIYGAKILNQDKIQRVKIPLPPLTEQKKIASFLDHHVGLIDKERELIARKISLLKEKKKALIYECVTGKRQLIEAQYLVGNDDWSDVIGVGSIVSIPAPKKGNPFTDKGCLVDSGIEWIGEVPEGWDIEKLKIVTKITKGKPIPKGIESDENGITPYLNGGMYPSFRINIAGNTSADVITISSGGASAGFVNYLDQETWVGGDCHIIKSCFKLYNKFVFYSLKAGEDFRTANQTGTAMPHVNRGDLEKEFIAFPSLQVQKNVASFLDHNISILDYECELLERKTELLNEKRKALIFELVTGKMRIGINNE